MEHNRGKESGPDKQPELCVYVCVCLAKSISVAPFGLDLELMSRWGESLKRDTQYLSSPLLSPVIRRATTHIKKKTKKTRHYHSRAEREATGAPALQKLKVHLWLQKEGNSSSVFSHQTDVTSQPTPDVSLWEKDL